MLIDIITIFPELFNGPFQHSIIKRAIENKIVKINIHDLRDYSEDKHKKVDDYPYGGGAGMIMKCEPLAKAIKHIKTLDEESSKIIYMTPQGITLNQKISNILSLEKRLIIICGHYKGIDERIVEKYVDMEISIGDYVLSGGELPSAVLIDSIIRLLPGALSDTISALEDSFQNGILDAPYYTRPEEFEGMRVPEDLLSGNHKKINEWREKESIKRTKIRRGDLLK